MGAHTQQKFIPHSSGGWKSEIRAIAWMNSGERSLPGCRLLNSHCVLIGGKQRKAASSLLTLIRALNPFTRAPPSWPHLILMTSHRLLLLISSHGGVFISTYESWGHNIQLITSTIQILCFNNPECIFFFKKTLYWGMIDTQTEKCFFNHCINTLICSRSALFIFPFLHPECRKDKYSRGRISCNFKQFTVSSKTGVVLFAGLFVLLQVHNGEKHSDCWFALVPLL